MHIPRRQSLPRCARLLLVIVPALLGSAINGDAQEASASIVGRVTDESGAVLPGVTVTTTSPALQAPSISATTDSGGEYRLSPLPIGTYQVDYSLSGFQTVRQENVRLTVGFVAKLDKIMKIGAVTETITVSGSAPTVDVTQTAATTELTHEQLNLTPTSRVGYISILSQAPGARTNLDVGGNQRVEGPQFRAFGQVGQSWQTLEGVLTTSSKNQQSGNFLDFNALEEVHIETVGANAEMPTRGIQLLAVVKSGGDSLHGSSSWAQTANRFQSSNLDDALRAQGIRESAKIQTRWNVAGDLGGRVIRNKLWYYGAFNELEAIDGVLNVYKPDGSPATVGPHERFVTGKLTYQAVPANRFIVFHQWDDLISRVPISQVSVFNPWESRADQTWNGHTFKGEWQGVAKDAVFSLQYGWRSWKNNYTGDSKLATTDIFTQNNTGLNWAFAGESTHEYLHHTKGSASWYRRDLLAGNHEFKVGFDYVAFTFNRLRRSRGSAGDYRLVFNSGAPFRIDTVNFPVESITKEHYLGTYLQDQWIIARRLTLNLGARITRDNGFVPEQCGEDGAFVTARCYDAVQFKTFTSLAPRISASYDLTGDGKTALKAGWGRFDHRRDIDPELTAANPNAAIVSQWRWRDLNGNRLYEPGEVDFAADFLSFAAIGANSASAPSVPNPDERQPRQDQFTLSLERQLVANLALRVTGVYSREFDVYALQNNRRPYGAYNIAITQSDPGLDGRVGTADDPGTALTYYEYPASLAGRQFEEQTLINPPGADKAYKSFEVAGSKRLSDGWQFMASYSATRSDEPNGSLLPSFDPNAEINQANRTWEWLGKVSGAYLFPLEVMFSANFEHRSGNPTARTVLLTGGRTITSFVVNAEAIGAQRLPNINLMDLRVEKRFQLTRAQRVSLRVNLYNALNVNTATAIQTRSGPSFGLTTAIVPPRIVEFGASWDF